MDDSLALRIAEDLDANFEALVRAHQDRLFSLALRYLGDHGEAEELTQDAFVRAYRALVGYDADRRRALAIRPWLSTIVLNLCRNRARRVRPALLDIAGVDGADGRGGRPATTDSLGSPEEAAMRREESEAWARRVRALPARYREPLLLRYVDELAYAEMSAALDIPEGTLRAQVHRGLALLRTALELEAASPAAGRPGLRLQEVSP